MSSSQITVKLGSVISEHGALFWRTETFDKETKVEDLIKTRIPDTCYCDIEDIHVICMQTNEILNKTHPLRLCRLEPHEQLKLIFLEKDHVAKIPVRLWRPLHKSCKFCVPK